MVWKWNRVLWYLGVHFPRQRSSTGWHTTLVSCCKMHETRNWTACIFSLLLTLKFYENACVGEDYLMQQNQVQPNNSNTNSFRDPGCRICVGFPTTKLELFYSIKIDWMLNQSTCACVLSCFSQVWLCATLWIIVHQAPLSLGFSRQEYWSGLPCPTRGDLLYPGTELPSLMSPALVGGFFTTSATWEALTWLR